MRTAVICEGLVEAETEEALLGGPGGPEGRRYESKEGKGGWWSLSSSGFVTEPASSTGEERLEAVFGRDMAGLAGGAASERRADVSSATMRGRGRTSRVGCRCTAGGQRLSVARAKVLCCRDLGRFRKSGKVCVSLAGTARVGVATYATDGGGAGRQAHRRRGRAASRAAGGRARGRGSTGAAADGGSGQPGGCQGAGGAHGGGRKTRSRDWGRHSGAGSGRTGQPGVWACRTQQAPLFAGALGGARVRRGDGCYGPPQGVRVSGAENW